MLRRCPPNFCHDQYRSGVCLEAVGNVKFEEFFAGFPEGALEGARRFFLAGEVFGFLGAIVGLVSWGSFFRRAFYALRKGLGLGGARLVTRRGFV